MMSPGELDVHLFELVALAGARIALVAIVRGECHTPLIVLCMNCNHSNVSHSLSTATIVGGITIEAMG